MKKILFALQTIVMGGVEKELITVLKHMDPAQWQPTVLVMYEQDKAMMEKIPDWVRIINLHLNKDYYCGSTIQVAKCHLKQGKCLGAFGIVVKKAFGIGQTGSKISLSTVPVLEEDFDTAVCYHLHSPLAVRYIAEKVKAKRKVAWIHNDFVNTGYRVDRIKKYLNAYDFFAAVSNKTRDEFLARCPQYAAHTKTVYNVLDKNEILGKSQEPCEIDAFVGNGVCRLLTVGRMEEQKGYDIAVEAARFLKEQGVSFIWFFAGAGRQEARIRKMVEDHNLSGCVKLLGKIENPYAYMDGCDIYVQPSRHEGYCLTVIEAKILAKPIICTDFAGAREQLTDGENGIIVPCDAPQKLAGAIIGLIDTPDTMMAFTKKLKEEREREQGFDEILACL